MSEKNTKTSWAIKINNKEESTIIQRVAFGYGYRWINSVDDPEPEIENLWASAYLIFDTTDKIIEWATCDCDIFNYCDELKTVNNIYNDVFGLFEKPRLNYVAFNEDISVYKDGSVDVDNYLIHGGIFDRLQSERDMFLGRSIKEVAPTKPQTIRVASVSFKYNSKSSGIKTRNIFVTNSEAKYLEGYDISDNYKFKRFSMLNVIGDIRFHSLVDYDCNAKLT